MWLEKIRLSLIRWNIAPWTGVIFLCYCFEKLINYIIDNGATLDPIFSSAVLGLIGTLALLLKECFVVMRKSEKKEDE